MELVFKKKEPRPKRTRRSSVFEVRDEVEAEDAPANKRSKASASRSGGKKAAPLRKTRQSDNSSSTGALNPQDVDRLAELVDPSLTPEQRLAEILALVLRMEKDKLQHEQTGSSDNSVAVEIGKAVESFLQSLEKNPLSVDAQEEEMEEEVDEETRVAKMNEELAKKCDTLQNLISCFEAEEASWQAIREGVSTSTMGAVASTSGVSDLSTDSLPEDIASKLSSLEELKSITPQVQSVVRMVQTQVEELCSATGRLKSLQSSAERAFESSVNAMVEKREKQSGVAGFSEAELMVRQLEDPLES